MSIWMKKKSFLKCITIFLFKKIFVFLKKVLIYQTKLTHHSGCDLFTMLCPTLISLSHTANSHWPSILHILQYFGHLTRRVDSLEKTLMLGGIGGRRRRRREDEMARWHHWLDGCESMELNGVGDGQGGLACCDSWGRKVLDMTERLNWGLS